MRFLLALAALALAGCGGPSPYQQANAYCSQQGWNTTQCGYAQSQASTYTVGQQVRSTVLTQGGIQMMQQSRQPMRSTTCTPNVTGGVTCQ